MQTDTIPRLTSTVKTPSTSSGTEFQSVTNNHNKSLGQLDNIFQSVKKQIEQWGENAKWKIDLILLDNPPQHQASNLHPLLSPQHFHPNAITTPADNNIGGGDSSTKKNKHLHVTSSIQYPWDFVAPTDDEWKQDSEDLQQKLRESIERQRYLESIIWSQAEQIKHSPIISDKEKAINTMRDIYLMSQHEQKTHHLVETTILQKDIEALSKKIKKMAKTLQDIEEIQVAPQDKDLDKEALLNDRTLLLRKLHLAELRLSARDTEIEYLHQVIDTLKANTMNTSSPKPQFQKKLRKGPPYLFQQQYSPRSEVRTSEPHPLSGLDSLGIVADQMLSDPEFEGSNSKSSVPEKRLRSRLDDRRSQRSIDSAATLLAMPQLMIPQRMKPEDTHSSPSPEHVKAMEHIPKKPRSTYTRWTEAEDKLLRAAVKKYGHSNWEACSRDVHGRSNIQCRNRWIRHLEHRPPPVEEEDEDEEEEEQQQQQQHRPPTTPERQRHINNARQSPSIAALLNSNDDYHYSPKSTPKQLYEQQQQQHPYHIHPTYRPPSPMATPKNGKRRSPEDMPTSTKW
ncbi:uncharacterized protein B0P05DRAFT_588536 [Gilbertella persicaria]|uniref:uncharacterized protein n=1 Tax=Gilbertella persicaria TaxID=101096 RepID=UPI002220265F|nr:uncharacterized protein B0P05DRAFT_588536 [Gilbertella persicaria]KAI8074215.1 hypothetical protein B0P05DRAFT_588536 [Gilbertella persicaria]